MTSKTATKDMNSEEVFSSDFVTDSEVDVPTVRYNAEAYRRKLERQLEDENPPRTLRDDEISPITQRAVPKAKKPSQASPPFKR